MREVSRHGTRGPSRVVAQMGSERASGYPRVVRLGRTLYFAWTATRPGSAVARATAALQ